MSETLEVKIGASDAGLEATLKTVQSELARLDTKIKGGDLSFKELDQTMRKIAQTEGLEKKLKAMGTDAAGTSPKIDALGGDLKAMGAKVEDAGEKGHMSLGWQSKPPLPPQMESSTHLGQRLRKPPIFNNSKRASTC